MAKNYSEDVSGINWKQFYKQVLVLIIPMALQNLNEMEQEMREKE